jgi:hypothetical protein
MTKALALWRRFLGRAKGGERPFEAVSEVDVRTFSAARFLLDRRPLQADTLEIALSPFSMRIEGSISTAEIRVRGHGLQIDSVLEGDGHRLLIYLGNYFIVPPELRRAGVATACIAAVRQAFQKAAFDQLRPDQKTVLEGYFVGPGEHWALAMCDGKLPTKACPAEVNLGRLQAAESKLTWLTQPAVQPEGKVG